MQFKSFFCAYFLVFLCYSHNTLLAQPAAAAANAITLEDIWQKYLFYPENSDDFRFLNDGKTYTQLNYSDDRSKVSIDAYQLIDGKKVRTFCTLDAALQPSDYAFNANESQVLVATAEEPLYRHSAVANYVVVDVKTQQVSQVSDKGKQRNATLDPTGNKVAFVRNNNLCISDLPTHTESSITTDGKPNSVINGAPDWVYEEEFSMGQAFWWSPSGSKIAYLRFDESQVPEFQLTAYDGELYPHYSSLKYPKAGERNASVSLHIYDLASQRTVKAAFNDTSDFYLFKVQWSPDGTLYAYHLNRHQNDLNIYKVNTQTGNIAAWLNEQNVSYVEVAAGTDLEDNYLFANNGKQMVAPSERDGFNHLYSYNTTDGKPTQITKGNWEVTKVYGIDPVRNLIYYQSTEDSPLQRHIYSIDLNGNNKKCLTLAQGWNDAEFSPTFDYYILTHSSANTPPSVTLYDKNGRKQREMVTNNRIVQLQASYNVSDVEFFKFTTPDNILLNGWMIKPPNFNANQRYPVLMYVYGGPASQEAIDQWSNFDYWWFQLLAQQGYIVACVDGRGTGGRGESFKKCTYLQLGKWETNDQIEAARWLGKQTYVDAARIGIFGWSYGGYMSLLAILKGNEVFKSAIAVAPVTNWKWYDSIYTERFLQTPAENESGYENNSPINFADRLRGNLLLVHGDADDNVHYQNSAEMLKAFVKANKQIDFMAYPNKNHSITGDNARLHLYTKMTQFLLNKL